VKDCKLKSLQVDIVENVGMALVAILSNNKNVYFIALDGHKGHPYIKKRPPILLEGF